MLIKTSQVIFLLKQARWCSESYCLCLFLFQGQISTFSVLENSGVVKASKTTLGCSFAFIIMKERRLLVELHLRRERVLWQLWRSRPKTHRIHPFSGLFYWTRLPKANQELHRSESFVYSTVIYLIYSFRCTIFGVLIAWRMNFMDVVLK